MTDRIAQISYQGQPLVSYRANPNKVLSPGTIPIGLIEELARSLGYEGPAALGWDKTTCEMWPEHVFHHSGSIEILIGKKIGPNHSDFRDSIVVPLEWDSVADYRVED